jgi:Spy/CpxP family protein refolding chaperone
MMLKKLWWSALTLAIVVLAAAPALAQPPRGGPGGRGGFGFGGGPLFLLTQKSVQEELKLSEEQIKKVTQLNEKQRESRGGFRDLSREEREKKMAEQAKETNKALADILKPEQLKRVKQIGWQQRGIGAIGSPEVAEALKLTSEQKDKIKSILEDASKARRELFTNRGGDREEARKKGEEIRKNTNEKLTGVLTAEQKTKWKEMLGEPFKGEIRRPEFPGGGRRPGGERTRGQRPGRGQPAPEKKP